MTVAELIAALRDMPQDAEVHLDVNADDDDGYEGSRVVRLLKYVRMQHGFHAVALDGYNTPDWPIDATHPTRFDKGAR